MRRRESLCCGTLVLSAIWAQTRYVYFLFVRYLTLTFVYSRMGSNRSLQGRKPDAQFAATCTQRYDGATPIM
ncbi:uncharacterized protein BJ212DRAFT_1402528 [Suillus subaureus]|nr:uncharacterized protein BJ212DRAFT_1402528 [Suillus subaureus]KAG1799107.1 hypothetical protein BJ212DRAFT_1402528 [Suillus subaureus]